MLINVRVEHTVKDKKNVYTGILNDNNCIFTSNDGSKKIKFDNTYEKYTYNGRIIFTDKEQEWIFLIIPSVKVLDKLGIKEDEEEEEDDEDEDETDSDSDYVYKDEEDDEDDEDEDYEDSEDEEYLP